MEIGSTRRRERGGRLQIVGAAIVVLLLLTLIGGYLFIRSGIYPIAATRDHLPMEVWVLEQMRDRSVQRHARDIVVPDLEERERILMGAVQYEGMCAACHGSPGEELGAMAQGMLPGPPRLDEERRLSSAEEFWITREGLKFTGMPAWGPTHSDEELWAVVALLRQLPDLSAAQYEELLAEAIEEGHVHDHDHDHDHDHEHQEHEDEHGHGDGEPPQDHHDHHEH